MINRDVHTHIDPERCIGCGLCVSVCPSETIVMKGKKAVVTGARSLSCGHCEAVCPTDAIEISCLNSPHFHSFTSSEKWIPYGEYDTGRLVGLMRSRRSCRNFTQEPLSLELLEDLVNAGACAPSGTNSQKWTFTILPDRKSVESAALEIAGFFRKLNRLARNRILRNALKIIGKSKLDKYYRDYYESVQEALNQYEKTGRDRLFHGATAAIIVGSQPGGSCPAEDALLAAQNILLAAHAMGLGSCLIGFAVEAMKAEKSIANALDIPDNESIHAVIALGYPDETYQKVCRRKKPVIRFVSQKTDKKIRR